ncbi:hypothetical protein H7A76_32075 [Pseudomonas sp. MSSRFD41]|uniref:hypothetical protein n=1 Tax=Pseudomonas sp. MSSRFD41 TaxID=1310370 RepID=UPI00163A89BC|nr:hypothetical protein [Pseudomonas sp. MSSRFD41]MBC2660090.1 hypothetical protein [Pseudomonas sp. MSSRFD41]
MDTNKMREQFEEWLKEVWPKALTIKYNSGDYRSETVQQSWVSWQASREAVVVELPPKISAHNKTANGYVRPEAEHYDEAIDDCREAIEAQGLRVKP